MATPMSHDQWLKALRAEGVTVQEYPGWRTRERDDETGLTFGPVHMFLNHHTAGRNSRDIVAKNGVPGLPAPLAHVYLAKSGVATMCSAGRANHAGTMARNAYTSFLNEQSTHPAPSQASGTIDGNDVSYGCETENLGDGKDVYPRTQYDAWVRINAAVCRYHGWSAESVGCHKETSVEGKVDPRGPVEGYGSRGRFEFTPRQFRADVAERLRHPASWSPSSVSKPSIPQSNPEEDGMPTVQEIAEAVMHFPMDDPRTSGTKYVRVKDVLWWIGADAAHANARTEALEAQVAALTAKVDRLIAANTQG
ncbi:peptidoglycan recognition protein family protein [Streptomyces lancefieldiae]|uniref:N-acetylmuramoyl-L-alanine amidase n=1 Tax=Streptomyces lancefieldiae TaxID=3075520 RepID=A0ABU3AFC9_9ACTN|nr:N-acetylmuramoyl-L-alanine amidase [Streptomyces sp. DSM 40712]MDT0608891.1 N-acetylmuramoyl-L-alanine amidase [Streptomyces sp. DSM 40712]